MMLASLRRKSEHLGVLVGSCCVECNRFAKTLDISISSHFPARSRLMRPARGLFQLAGKHDFHFKRTLSYRLPASRDNPSIASRNARSLANATRRRSTTSADRNPCFHMPFAGPGGAPGEAPPCIRHRPFGIAADRHGVALRVRAPRRRTRLCEPMHGLVAVFCITPHR